MLTVGYPPLPARCNNKHISPLISLWCLASAIASLSSNSLIFNCKILAQQAKFHFA